MRAVITLAVTGPSWVVAIEGLPDQPPRFGSTVEEALVLMVQDLAQRVRRSEDSQSTDEKG